MAWVKTGEYRQCGKERPATAAVLLGESARGCGSGEATEANPLVIP
jgi:hypothetical protein